MDTFLKTLSDLSPQSEEKVFDSILHQYERVILESLLSAFLLDFMINDLHGGDVDTINNVRQIGIDPKMDYKNANNKSVYENRSSYSRKDVEGPGTNYQQIKHNARSTYNVDNKKTVMDAYENKTLHFLSKSKGRPTDQNANLDHVIPVKKIHDDRGRVLSGLSTKDLADSEKNFAWTNEHLNKSLGYKDKQEYINEHPELSEETKRNMLKLKKEAEFEQEKKIFQEYYLNPNNPRCRQFYKDAVISAQKRGVEMGIRQALGFVFVEVYIVTMQEIKEVQGGCDFVEILKAVVNGLKKGFASALSKYKEILVKFGEGFIAGGLASLCTTLCNVFLLQVSLLLRTLGK